MIPAPNGHSPRWLMDRPSLRPLAPMLVAVLVLFAGSCKGASEVCSPSDPLCGDGGGGGAAPVFPAIAQSTLDFYCIRGEAVPTTSKSGSVTSADCPSQLGDGFLEGWRVRVASNASVTFEVTSNLDTLLELWRVDDVNDLAGSAVLIAEDDDSGSGFNALLTAQLTVNTEYLVFVEGWDEIEQGPYTLNMTAP